MESLMGQKLTIFVIAIIILFHTNGASNERKTIQIKHLSAKELGFHLVNHRYEIKLPDGKKVGFDLVDPEMAPPDIYEEVMFGYRLMIDTPNEAKEYVRARISCTNCHFGGGNTLGGRNGAISLVGVTTTYPKYSARDKKVLDLEDRISNCFMRSLNGIAPAKDSKIMLALVAYMKWISKEVASIKNIPWLGLQVVKSSHKPNLKAGASVYEQRCSACHKSDGEGAKGIPPLWGKDSFNTGAGMNNLPMVTAFIYWNMPYQEPVLTIEEAIDVAGYITSKPRPTFIPPQEVKK